MQATDFRYGDDLSDPRWHSFRSRHQVVKETRKHRGIFLNRVVKTADSRGDVYDPPSAMVLQSANVFSARVLAYQARSGTGSVDKIEQHRFPRQRGEVNLLGIGRIAE